MEQKFYVTCLIVQNENILMLQKEKGRHLGAWVFPGGELKDDESPLDAIKREVIRETGYMLEKVELRGITSFLMQETPHNEVLFRTNLYVFYSEDIKGELIQSNRGSLHWIPLKEIWARQVGRNDPLFIPPMLEKKGVTFATFYHDKNKKLNNYRIE